MIEEIDHMVNIGRALSRLGETPFVVHWPKAPPKGDAANFPGDAAAVWDLLANAVPWEEPPEPAKEVNSEFATHF